MADLIFVPLITITVAMWILITATVIREWDEDDDDDDDNGGGYLEPVYLYLTVEV